MRVVLSQPMFFPWIGLFEQIELADVYIHLDDVLMPGGQSFMHRVQLLNKKSFFWWNLPIKRVGLSKKKISEVEINLSPTWIKKSHRTLDQTFSKFANKKDALDIFENVVTKGFNNLSKFNIYLIEYISKFLEIECLFNHRNVINRSEDKTSNVINLLCAEGASEYISGLGGKEYLCQDQFDKKNIKLKFMNYRNIEYYQNSTQPFNPYVSILLPIASMGKDAKKLLVSKAM